MNRRAFLRNAGAAGAAFVGFRGLSFPASYAQNAKVNIAFIGVGGRGGGNLNETMGSGMANCVALCDVDQKTLDGAAGKYPDAKKYNDFRKLFEECAKEIDAAVIATPDHCHAPAAAMAMKLRKHVYVEKPMTHSIFEARTLTELAAKHKVVTQMGNQGHSSDSRRRLVEFLQAGGIGKVTEVHAWTNRPIWPQGLDRPPSKKVPDHLNWDLWIGPAPFREYHDNLHNFSWRGWWDFGTGALGDMACHIMDAPFWGLKLGYPTNIEVEGGPLKPDCGPNWETIRLDFPARGPNLPPVKFTWYDGKKDGKQNGPPEELAKGVKFTNNGNIIIGDKGTVVVLDEQTGNWKVVIDGQVKDKKDVEVKRVFPRPREHHVEWLDGIRGGPMPEGNFAYSGPFTESVLIGIPAFRAQTKLVWDGPNMKATNTRDADKYIKREYRKGWTL
jgi:predicted dehydrogenase